MRRRVARRTRPTSTKIFRDGTIVYRVLAEGYCEAGAYWSVSHTGGQQAPTLDGGCRRSAGAFSVQFSASENAHAKELIPVLLEQIGTNERFKDQFR